MNVTGKGLFVGRRVGAGLQREYSERTFGNNLDAGNGPEYTQRGCGKTYLDAGNGTANNENK